MSWTEYTTKAKDVDFVIEGEGMCCDIIVTFDHCGGGEPRLSGNPDNRHDGSGEEVDVTSVLVELGDFWVEVEPIAPALRKSATKAAWAHIEELKNDF